MKRIEIYLDNNDSLTVTAFKTIDSSYEKIVLKGRSTYEYIKKLSNSKLIDLCEYKSKNDVLLEYKNYIIVLNEYNKLLNKKGLGPLLKNIKDFKEKESLKTTTIKSVTRRNKYNNRRIIASGLTVLVLGGCALGYFKKNEMQEKKFNIESINSIVSLEDNDDINKLIFESKMEEKKDNSIVEDKKIADKTESKVEETKEVEEESQKNKEKSETISHLTISYEDRSSKPKVQNTKTNYWNLINIYSEEFGLDPNLILAIATQERGVHSSIQDKGGATGLMQIQNNVWENKYISAYNFKTNSREKIFVTKDKIEDLNYNIKFGCMYFQNCLEYMNHNILAAVQCYNMGRGNMMKVLKAYSSQTNKTIEQILNDESDLGWLKYRYIPSVGDTKYIENVFSWLGEDIELNNFKKGNTTSISKARH